MIVCVRKEGSRMNAGPGKDLFDSVQAYSDMGVHQVGNGLKPTPLLDVNLIKPTPAVEKPQ